MALYPPYIEGKLPAQEGDTLSIPFQLNRAVGRDEIKGICAIIRTVSTGVPVGEILLGEIKNPEAGSNIYTASIRLTDNLLKVGQYYKIQVAFCEKIVEGEDKKLQPKEIGYYSTVGVFKYTVAPKLIIEGLKPNDTNDYVNSFVGVCTYNDQDLGEKIYSYAFYLYKDGQIIETSGEQLHNSSVDTSNNIVHNIYTYKTDLVYEEYYNLWYEITTINGLRASSPVYRVKRSSAYQDPMLPGELVAIANNDAGCVELYLQPSRAGTFEGQFHILRTSNGITHTIYDTIYYHEFDSANNESILLFKDFTAESGINYTYGLQKYNNSITASPLNASVMLNYEDMSLTDGERSLNIKFNPKVTSFKNTLQETKTDTIGGGYPFFYRNGRLKYKEFPISGLISVHMDNAKSFMNKEYDITTNLTAENFAQEREFKLAVLEWLTNGKLKVFKSPAEGCYLVRLMNVSLSPNDTLGRMLHTFSATAYEIAEYTTENLLSFGMLGASNQQTPLTFKQISLSNGSEVDLSGQYGEVVFARITGNKTGSRYNISIDNGSSTISSMTITVPTSEYNIFIDKTSKLTDIECTGGEGGTLEIGYYPNVDTRFYRADGKAIFGWKHVQKIDQIQGGQEFKPNGDDTNAIVNIAFLRICTKQLEPEINAGNEDNYKYTINWGNNKSSSVILASGRIEYTLNDFNGRFTFESLQLGSELYADICYTISTPQ